MHATLLTLLSEDHWHGSWFWPLVPLAWLLVLLLAFRFLFWGRWGGGRRWDGGGPRRILAERYARGEISHGEYRDRLSHLEGR